MTGKHKALFLKNKIENLKEFDMSAGLTKVEATKKFDILVTTLKTIVYDRKKIEAMAVAYGNSALKKLCVQGKFPKVEEILMMFFT